MRACSTSSAKATDTGGAERQKQSQPAQREAVALCVKSEAMPCNNRSILKSTPSLTQDNRVHVFLAERCKPTILFTGSTLTNFDMQANERHEQTHLTTTTSSTTFLKASSTPTLSFELVSKYGHCSRSARALASSYRTTRLSFRSTYMGTQSNARHHEKDHRMTLDRNSPRIASAPPRFNKRRSVVA